MAQNNTTIYIKPNGTFLNIGAMLRCSIEKCEFIYITGQTAGAVRPALTDVEYTSVDATATDVICSGTGKLVSSTVCIAAQDYASASTLVPHIIKAPNLLFPVESGQTPVVGGNLYWSSPGGTVFTTDAANRYWIGKCLKLAETDPAGLPAGEYVEVNFDQHPS